MAPRASLLLSTAAMCLALSACESGPKAAAPPASTAVATSVSEPLAAAALKLGNGADAGTATITHGARGLHITVKVHGITPGRHGVHIHATGSCEGPDFTSAGGHWNPQATQHGLENPLGHHAGDMPNLVVDAGGAGLLEQDLTAATLEGLFDADGSAIIVHAGEDDQRSAPSGNSGARVACGVFENP